MFKYLILFKLFLVRSFDISTFVTSATIQILMSPLLNVSALDSTQCLCLGLQHSAAWCLYSGNDLLFISKGRFVNKPKHLLRSKKRQVFLCITLIAVYSGNKSRLVFKLSLRHFLFLFFWTELLANLRNDSTEICYLCIN